MTVTALSGQPPPRSQRALSLVALLGVVASALVGGTFLGSRERLSGSESPVARPAAGSRVATDPAAGARAQTTIPPGGTRRC